MNIKTLSTAFAAVLLMIHTSRAAEPEEKFPQMWRKSMTNDPATNYALKKFTAPLPTKLETVGRNIIIAGLLGQACRGVSVNRKKWRSYLEASGINHLRKSEFKELSDKTESTFIGFDYRELAHLCAGIDYMYGAKGIMVKNLMTAGSGEPNFAYDANNPYLHLSPLTTK